MNHNDTRIGRESPEWLLYNLGEENQRDPWKLVSTKILDDSARDAFIGNGYIGLLVPPEGEGSWQGRNMFRSSRFRGALGGSQIHGHWGKDSLMDLPRWAGLRFNDGRSVFSRFNGITTNYKQTLDMRTATVTTELDWQSCPDSMGVRRTNHLQIRTWLSRTIRNLGVIEMTVTPDTSGDVVFIDTLDASFLSDVSECRIEFDKAMTMSLHQGPSNRPLVISSRLCFDPEAFVREYTHTEQNKGERGICFRMEAGKSVTVTKLVGIYTCEDGSELPVQSNHMLSCVAKNIPHVYQQHMKAWNVLWESDIEIPHTGVQKIVRACLYQFYSQLRPDIVWSLGPCGITGAKAWAGRAFWDADLWMSPPLMLLHPELAECIIAYRGKTLEGARRNARHEGRTGARFAWESTETGDEICLGVTAEQVHNIGDIALTQWWFRMIAGDEAFQRIKGNDVILGCAQYFASRAEYNKELDRYELRNVCCADEFSGIVNNNTYSNFAAVRTLELASDLLREGGESVPQKWNEIRSKMFLPYNDELGTFNEHDSYQGKAIKQSDTALLVYPYSMPMTRVEKERIASYYPERYPKHKIMMSSAIDGVVFAELGDAEKAWLAFLDLLPHFKPPFLSASESPDNEVMSFATGLGGTLQLILNGFLGLRIRAGGLYFAPCFPKSLPGLTVRGMHCNGTRFDLEACANSIHILNLQGPRSFDINVGPDVTLVVDEYEGH